MAGADHPWAHRDDLFRARFPTTTGLGTVGGKQRLHRHVGHALKQFGQVVTTYGATDDLGFHVVDKSVHVHDLQATILHCLGFDHERLTFHHAGRDFRLTDVHGQVVRDILA